MTVDLGPMTVDLSPKQLRIVGVVVCVFAAPVVSEAAAARADTCEVFEVWCNKQLSVKLTRT